MKNTLSKIANQMINSFDQELISLVKEDIQHQKVNIINKLIHMNTVNFDKELYQIIKQDILLIKEQLCNNQRTLAQAG